MHLGKPFRTVSQEDQASTTEVSGLRHAWGSGLYSMHADGSTGGPQGLLVALFNINTSVRNKNLSSGHWPSQLDARMHFKLEQDI